MAKVLWAISFLNTIGAFFYYNLSSANGAIQQAALATMTLVIIILPYCLARSWAEIEKLNKL